MQAASTDSMTLDNIKQVTLPSPAWSIQTPSLSSKVKVNVQSSSAQPLVISHTVTVHSDFTWTLTVHGHVVSQEQCSAILGSASSNSLLLGRETNPSKTNPDFAITLGARGSGELPPTAPDPPRLSVLLERPASYRGRAS